MEPDRRKAVRIKKLIFTQYYNKDKNLWNMASVRDFSEGGMLINSDILFQPNQIVDVRIKMPSHPQEWIEIKARVIESRKYLTRVQFLELKKEHKDMIKEYVQWFLDKGGKL